MVSFALYPGNMKNEVIPIMNKLVSIVLALSAAALLFPGELSAQVQIQTRKLKISDFTTCTTRVVLGGNEIFNISLQEEVARRWMASPFEFCSVEEYEASKTDSKYYFLVPQSRLTRQETEPGINVLTLVKGGKGDEALEVVSVPYSPSESPGGRELVFLPAILSIIQSFTLDAMSSDKVSLKGLEGYAAGMGKARKSRVVVSSGDVAPCAAGSALLKGRSLELLAEDDADAVFEAGEPGTLVTYTVSPSYPQKGAVSYTCLIGADNYKLYYFASHKAKDASKCGYTAKDLKKIGGGKK